MGSAIWTSKSVLGYTNWISTVNWAEVGVICISITQIFEIWPIATNTTEPVRTGMIWLLFSRGMSLVEDCSWKSYSLAEDQREDRTWGQAAGPSLQRKSWLWEYTRTSSDVSCPFRPLQIGYVGRNCFPSLSSSPGLEEGRHGKRIGTLPLGPKHYKQNSQFNSVV